MTFQDFKNNIENVYHNKFENSAVTCRIFKCLGSRSISISCYMAANNKECISGIPANDMMRISFFISLPNTWNKDCPLPDNLTLRCDSKNIKVKPENEILYCSTKKVSYRKTSGDPDKLIKSFKRFVDRLYEAVEAEYRAENLLDYDMSLCSEKGYFS